MYDNDGNPPIRRRPPFEDGHCLNTNCIRRRPLMEDSLHQQIFASEDSLHLRTTFIHHKMTYITRKSPLEDPSMMAFIEIPLLSAS